MIEPDEAVKQSSFLSTTTLSSSLSVSVFSLSIAASAPLIFSFYVPSTLCETTTVFYLHVLRALPLRKSRGAVLVNEAAISQEKNGDE
jgi:hypothetical protein